MRFSRELFNKYAAPHIKRMIPKEHIDLLDGKEVYFAEGSVLGTIYYEIDNEPYYLYQVVLGWCQE